MEFERPGGDKTTPTTEYYNVQEQTHAQSGVLGGACDPRN